MLANPWVILAIVLAYLGSVGFVGWKAYHMGGDAIIAAQVKDEAARREERAQVMQDVAEAVSKIEVKNVTIRQKAETITREVPVYNDCRHDPNGLRLINDALGAGPGPANPGKLPGADGAGG